MEQEGSIKISQTLKCRVLIVNEKEQPDAHDVDLKTLRQTQNDNDLIENGNIRKDILFCDDVNEHKMRQYYDYGQNDNQDLERSIKRRRPYENEYSSTEISKFSSIFYYGTEVIINSNKNAFCINSIKDGRFNHCLKELNTEKGFLISDVYNKLKRKRKTTCNLQQSLCQPMYQSYECNQFRAKYIIFHNEWKAGREYAQHNIFYQDNCFFYYWISTVENVCFFYQHDKEEENSNASDRQELNYGKKKEGLTESDNVPDLAGHSIEERQLKQTPGYLDVIQNIGGVDMLYEHRRAKSTHVSIGYEIKLEHHSVPEIKTQTGYAQPFQQQNEILMPAKLENNAERAETILEDVYFVEDSKDMKGLVATPVNVEDSKDMKGLVATPVNVEDSKDMKGLVATPVNVEDSKDMKGLVATPVNVEDSKDMKGLVATPVNVEDSKDMKGLVATPVNVEDSEGMKALVATPVNVEDSEGMKALVATPVKLIMDEPTAVSNSRYVTQTRNLHDLLPTKREYKAQRKQGDALAQPMVQPQKEANSEELGMRNQGSSSVLLNNDDEIEKLAQTSEKGFVREADMVAAAEVEPLFLEERSSSELEPHILKDLCQPTSKALMRSCRRQQAQIHPLWRHKGIALMFMRHELLRVCSFIKEKAVTAHFQSFTRLAHYGFYSVCGTGMVRCYSCGQEHKNGLQDMPPDVAHDKDCTWKQNNITLMGSFHSLSNDELQKYLKVYSIGWTKDSTQNRESYFESNPDSSNFGIAELSESSEGEEDDCASDPITSASGRPLASVNSSSADYVFGNRRRSLPDNLSALSSPVVIEESHQPTEASNVILTSASKKPVSRPTAQGAASAEGFDLTKASYPLYASSYSRSQTYGAWSRDHPKRPEHLTKAGFFYAGYGDCVRCFYCGLGLKYWKPEDIPEYQHARFRPNCVYNLMYMGPEYIDRVQADRGGGPAASHYLGRQQPGDQSHVNQQGPRNSETAQAIATVTVGNTGSAQMAAQGATDAVSGLSQGRMGDDSGIETSTSTPGTGLSLDDTGSEAGAALNSSSFGNSPSLSQADQGASSQVYPNPPKPEESVHVRQQLAEVENSLLSQRVLCHVCMAKPIECVYMPCGHVVACKSCAEAASNCLICSRVIVATANIYLS